MIGGNAMELEQIRAEGIALQQCTMSEKELFEIRNRSRIALMPLSNGLLQSFHVSKFV